MDALSRAVGSGTDITIKGKTYQLSPLGLEDYGEIKNHILNSRKDPMQILRETDYTGMPQAVIDSLTKHAFEACRKNDEISPDDIYSFMNTPEGMPFTLWVTARRNHPEVDTLEKAQALFKDLCDELGEAGIEEFVKRRDQAAGIDAAGNSTGQEQESESK